MKSEQNLKKVVPFNPQEGLARTVKSQYYKNGFLNFFMQNCYGATGVLEVTDKRGQGWSE